MSRSRGARWEPSCLPEVRGGGFGPVDLGVAEEGVRRRRREACGTGWVVSAVLHLALLLGISCLLLPLDSGQSARWDLEAALQSEAAPPETLAMPDGSLGRDAGLEDPLVPELEAVPVQLAWGGGGSGQGSGGWQGGSPGAGGEGGGRSGPRAEYFGTVAYGDRFVFVLDMSNSMNNGRSGRPRAGCRFDRAAYELLRSVDRLTPDQYFYVILFSSGTRCMFDETSPIPQLVRATRENKARLREWLAGIEVGGSTDPREALQLALQLQPSAVFMLSDGEFNGRRSGNRRGIFRDNPDVSEVVARNNVGQVPIHTFAYEDPVSKERMRQLAQQTGGQYRYIEPLTKAQKRAAGGRLVSSSTPRPAVSKEKQAASLLDAGDRLHADGKTAKAVQWYRRVIQRFPQTKAAHEAGRKLQQLASQ